MFADLEIMIHNHGNFSRTEGVFAKWILLLLDQISFITVVDIFLLITVSDQDVGGAVGDDEDTGVDHVISVILVNARIKITKTVTFRS